MKNKFIPIQKQLDNRSKFFCAAKWTELYLYLNHGNSNSCNHPIPHRIPENLLEDPYVLHNTPHKLQQQKLMLEGHRPQECHMCWHIEDSNPEVVSERIRKSWRWQDQIDTLTVDNKTVPSFIEVVFDNLCNMTCSYCDSGQSSSWAAEIHKQPLALVTDYRNLYSKITIESGQTKSEYYEAWLRWWPMIKDQVNTLKISGGEPLLSNHFWKFFEVLSESSQLELQLNSNFCVDTKRIQQLISKSQDFKSVYVSVSVDAKDQIAQWTRKGMDYNLLMSNIDHWCTHSPNNCAMKIQSTVSIFSIWGFADFLELFVELKKRYPGKVDNFYTTIVRFPEFQSVSLLPQDIKLHLHDQIYQTWQCLAAEFDETQTSFIVKVLSYLKNDPKPLIEIDRCNLVGDLLKFIDWYQQSTLLKLDQVFPKVFVDWIQTLRTN